MSRETTTRDLADVREIWAKVAEARTEKGDHEGAVRALRAVRMNEPASYRPGTYDPQRSRR